MDLSVAPTLDDEERECPICPEEGEYVVYDGDTVCRQCGHVPSATRSPTRDVTAWHTWHEHRRDADDYSGWCGEDRIKMVGGFVAAYEFGEDFDLGDERSKLLA